ncbi:MAG: response regulator [Chloroflexi bacterium]|nr:response regulator [Chloroflexota bacterium]
MNELKGKRIFIVEDDVTNMAVYAVTLRQTGATVIRDYLNTDSISLLTNHLPIDVILLDLMLRFRVSGYDIYDELAAHPELADIPVIAVSASDPALEIPKAKAKGFAGFIGKPINPRKFPEQIAACINGEPVWYAHHNSLEDI